jgi:hypothetical protein
MPVPTAYTESTLAEYMLTVLSGTADALQITLGDLGEAVIEVLLKYGVNDISAAMDMTKLRCLARVEAWKAAADMVAADYDFSEGAVSYHRSQMSQQIAIRLSQAERDAAPYDPSNEVGVVAVDYVQNPYRLFDEVE